MSRHGRRIAIIGAGFSGTLLAVHLVRHSREGDRVYLLDRDERVGRGLAFAAGNPNHLLNVPATAMSAFGDEPDHFVDWLKRRRVVGPRDPGGAEGPLFAPRQLYGAYVRQILAHHTRPGAGEGRLAVLAGNVTDVRPAGDRVTIETAVGRRLDADVAVLAIGNLPPDRSRPGYYGDPWEPGATAPLANGLPILLLGSGLTMVDVVLSLLDRDHRTPILAISRRGLLPRVHAETGTHPRFLPAGEAPATVRGLLRAVRGEVDRARGSGTDWRAVVDSLRGDTQDIWRRLPLTERQRFLRHLRPWWDVHRHRMAPIVAARIEAAIQAGRLTVRRGRLQAIAPDPARIGVEVLFVGDKEPQRFHAGRVVNCTGPRSDYETIDDPLVDNLLANGLARPDTLRLGLDATADGALIGRDGTASARLFALGPVTKGIFWETTAVPDIRLQCERLAGHLETVLRPSHGGAGRAWRQGPGRARGAAGALLKALEAS